METKKYPYHIQKIAFLRELTQRSAQSLPHHLNNKRIKEKYHTACNTAEQYIYIYIHTCIYIYI